MQKRSGSAEWEERLLELNRKANILDDDDAAVYIALLKSKKPLTGNQLSSLFPELKRTHIYSILNRLQQDELVEIKNPGKRPAEYAALDPLRPIETLIRKTRTSVANLEESNGHGQKNSAWNYSCSITMTIHQHRKRT